MLSVISSARREVWRAVATNDPAALSDHVPAWFDALRARVGIAYLTGQLLVAVLLLIGGRSGVLEAPRVRRRRTERELSQRLDRALAVMDLSATTPHRPLSSESDVLVVAVDPPSGPAVLKIATSPAASARLDRHADILRGFAPAVTEGPLGPLLPRIERRGVLDGERVLLETRLPGITSTDPAATPAALAAIATLHAATAATTRVAPALLEAWVDEPMAHLRRLPARLAKPAGLDALAATLHRALAGSDVTVSAVHGDFWSGNVLFSWAGGSWWVVSGIVDWDDAKPVGLPDADLALWWLGAQPRGWGASVRRVLDDPAAADDALASLPVERLNPQLSGETVVLLAWLNHVAGCLARAVRNPLSPIWAARNVRPVVARFRPRRPGREDIMTPTPSSRRGLDLRTTLQHTHPSCRGDPHLSCNVGPTSHPAASRKHTSRRACNI